jgi:hypothetical protein
MRRATFVLCLALSAACGSGTDSSGPPASPYNVSVITKNESGGSGQVYNDVIVYEVTDKNSGAAVSGATVVTQATAGAVAPIPLVTAGNGRVTATWTIEVADQGAGTTHALATCSPEIGGSVCQTKFSDPQTVRVTF